MDVAASKLSLPCPNCGYDWAYGYVDARDARSAIVIAKGNTIKCISCKKIFDKETFLHNSRNR